MLSELALGYVQRPRNVGPLESPARYGVSGAPGDGPSVEVWLHVRDGVIVNAAARTHGCPSSIACAGLICDLIRGRTIEQAKLLTAEDLLTVLGGLPDGKGHLAGMAVDAVHRAIDGGESDAL